ncbi:MAG: glycoside hydrolase family 36 N-terminal domain-containing protein [Bifidobacterium adolescentis]
MNTGEGQLEVGKIELAFTVPADANEILTTTGHHLRERSPQRQDFALGRFAKASMAGRPDFDATLRSASAKRLPASRTATSARTRGMER